MNYSSNPVMDAIRHITSVEKDQAEQEAVRRDLEDQLNAAIAKGDANGLCQFATVTDWAVVHRQPVDQQTATRLPRRAQTLTEVLLESVNGYPEVETQLVQLLLNACKSSDTDLALQAGELRDSLVAKWVAVIAKSISAAVLALAGIGAQAADLQADAVTGQAADVGSTAVGLVLGASEANPLGILTIGAKAIAYQRILEAPATEQPQLWSAYGAFGWGAAANNLCVIAAIATSGAAAALCPLIGVAAGLTVYSSDAERRDRATFDALCKQERAINPAMECVYTADATGAKQ